MMNSNPVLAALVLIVVLCAVIAVSDYFLEKAARFCEDPGGRVIEILHFMNEEIHKEFDS